MKDTCTQDSLRDFKQRYHNTIGSIIKEDGSRDWVFIDEVREDGVLFKDNKGNSFHAVNGLGTEFEFTQVPMGWFNTSKGPILFSRKPAKQYQRGIAKANTLVRNSDLCSIDLTLARVAEAFTYNKKWEGKLPWALNKFFCIGGKNILYFYSEPIGMIENNVIKISAACQVAQELRDTIQRLALPFTVELEA